MAVVLAALVLVALAIVLALAIEADPAVATSITTRG